MQLSVTESSFEPRTARVVARACWRHTLARANISCDILFNNNIDSLNKKTTRSKCSHAVISIKLCLDNRARFGGSNTLFEQGVQSEGSSRSCTQD